MRALLRRLADEAMPFEDGVGKSEFARPVRNERAGLEAPRRDGDVVGLRRNAGHPLEFETIVHPVFPGAARCSWHGAFNIGKRRPRVVSARRERLDSGRRDSSNRLPGGRLAQRESTVFTRRGSLVQIQQRPPARTCRRPGAPA